MGRKYFCDHTPRSSQIASAAQYTAAIKVYGNIDRRSRRHVGRGFEEFRRIIAEIAPGKGNEKPCAGNEWRASGRARAVWRDAPPIAG